MSWTLKLVGAALVLGAAAVVSKKYARHLRLRAELTRGYAELLGHIKSKISAYLAPPSELIVGFECDSLERVGYLAAARESGTPVKAYFDVRERCPLEAESLRLLDGYFRGFGKNYKDDLVRITEEVRGELDARASRLFEELPREVRLSRTVIFAIALGAVILLV